MDEPRPNVLTLAPSALSQWLADLGEPSYRAQQVLDGLYVRRTESFDRMTDLSRPLRRALEQAFCMDVPREVRRERSRNKLTEKYLLELADGERIESVWMADRTHGTHTFCVSSQAGCALGCAFCATGLMGLGRDLTVGEVIGQVMVMARARGWPANVVFMGMGEPLLNLAALLPALESLADARRFALGARRITVSTAGIVPGIRVLAGSPVRPNLALSLNSPFEDQRAELMPISRKYPLSAVLPACAEYAERTGRRLLMEYVLLGGVNTSRRAAQAVAQIARDFRALVNLIAFNPAEGCRFRTPERDELVRFRAVLEQEKVSVTQRFRRGREIAAGCGQLRGRHAGASAARGGAEGAP